MFGFGGGPGASASKRVRFHPASTTHFLARLRTPRILQMVQLWTMQHILTIMSPPTVTRCIQWVTTEQSLVEIQISMYLLSWQHITPTENVIFVYDIRSNKLWQNDMIVLSNVLIALSNVSFMIVLSNVFINYSYCSSYFVRTRFIEHKI